MFDIPLERIEAVSTALVLLSQALDQVKSQAQGIGQGQFDAQVQQLNVQVDQLSTQLQSYSTRLSSFCLGNIELRRLRGAVTNQEKVCGEMRLKTYELMDTPNFIDVPQYR